MANLPLPILFPSSVLIILIFLCILRRMVLGGVGGMHQIFSIVKLLQGSLCGEVSSFLNVRGFFLVFLFFFITGHFPFPLQPGRVPQPHAHRGILFVRQWLGGWGGCVCPELKLEQGGLQSLAMAQGLNQWHPAQAMDRLKSVVEGSWSRVFNQ